MTAHISPPGTPSNKTGDIFEDFRQAQEQPPTAKQLRELEKDLLLSSHALSQHEATPATGIWRRLPAAGADKLECFLC